MWCWVGLGVVGSSLTLSDLFEAWICLPLAPKGKEMWKLSFFVVIWIIWKERNARC